MNQEINAYLTRRIRHQRPICQGWTRCRRLRHAEQHRPVHPRGAGEVACAGGGIEDRVAVDQRVMPVSSDFQNNLIRVCELLRGSGMPEANVEALAAQWSQNASIAELEQLAAALKALEKAAVAVMAERSPQTHSVAKYPHVRVKLHDLGDKAGPILRRVTAMSDAGVDEVRSSNSSAGGQPATPAMWQALGQRRLSLTGSSGTASRRRRAPPR